MKNKQNEYLPPGWAKAPLSKVVQPRGEKVSPSDYPSLPFIGMDHVEAHTTRILGTIPASDMKSNAARFYGGDILYGRLRPYLNKVAQMQFEGLASAEFIIFPDTEFLRSAFLKYRLNAADFVSFASHLNEGDRPRVNFGQIGDFKILVPPTDEQVRIVTKIEELFSELNKGIESLKTAREQLRAYRQAVLKHAFEGKLTEEWRKKHADEQESVETLLGNIKAKREQRYREKINHRGKLINARKVESGEGKKLTNPGNLKKLPKGWTGSTVEEVAEINPRLNKLDLRDDLYVSFVPMSAVGPGDGTIDVSQKREFGEVKKGFTPFQEKDVLFAKITPCMENGKMAVVPKVMNGYGFGSTEFHVLRPERGIDPWYLYFYVSSKVFRGKAMQHMTGGVGQKRVPSGYLAEHQIPLCSRSEQIQIVQQLETRLSAAERLEQDIEDGLKQAEALRQSLLKKAFEGRLVPQDSNDESASVLLERIKTEKAKLKKKIRKEKKVAV